MEGSNVVYSRQKQADGSIKEYPVCRECRNATQKRYQAKRRAKLRAAATAAAELAAREAAYWSDHCKHCRDEPRAADLAYIASLSRVIAELGGTVPDGPKG